jgi:hypothetical protein
LRFGFEGTSFIHAPLKCIPVHANGLKSVGGAHQILGQGWGGFKLNIVANSKLLFKTALGSECEDQVLSFDRKNPEVKDLMTM